jgi:Uma2 family endonuclease
MLLVPPAALRYHQTMQAANPIPASEIVGTADQRVVMHGVPWAHFEAILALRGDTSVPRLSYLRGALELMTPSRNHESIKTLLARMIEHYAMEAGIRLSGYGSWTLRSAPKERAIEPDECYVLGDPHLKNTPDLAIEVVWTSGGLDKLEVYRGLGVAEVWLWRDEAIRIYRLEGDQYVQMSRSELLPDLDIALLARLAGCEDQHQALIEFHQALKGH